MEKLWHLVKAILVPAKCVRPTDQLRYSQVITEDDKTIEFISTQTEEIIALVAVNYGLVLRLQEHVGELKKLEIIFRLNLRKQRRRKIKDQRKLKTKWLRSDN